MSDSPEHRGRPWLVFVPLAAFFGFAALLFVYLFGGDHSRLPSPLIGKPAPAFSLAGLEGASDGLGLGDADLRGGHVSVVNVFASWCGPCREEHPLLLRLAKDEKLKAEGVQLVGLANKDKAADALKFLNEYGDPYGRIGMDLSGRVGIDWGVYGVPETFVVRGDGTIAYKFIGPLSAEALASVLLPEIEKAAK